MNYGAINLTSQNVQVRKTKNYTECSFFGYHIYFDLNIVIEVPFMSHYMYSRQDTTQSALLSTSVSLDHSLTAQQAVTQVSTRAAMSMNLVAGLSG